MTKLKELDLSGNYINNIKVLERVKFNNLEKYNLSNNSISDIDVFEKINYKKLKKLDLSDIYIQNITIFEKIFKFNQLENLDYLDLGYNRDIINNKNKFSSAINMLTNLKEFKMEEFYFNN